MSVSLKNKKLKLDASFSGDLFVHIGKTGGSFIKKNLKEISKSKGAIKVFGHSVTAKKLLSKAPDASLVFSVRDPITLFVSGFNSRLREGRPTYNIKWSLGERFSFLAFKSANELAESLDSDDIFKRTAACLSMMTIVHVKKGLKFYLHGVNFLEKNKKRISFILDQATLNEDFEEYIISRHHGVSSNISELINYNRVHEAPENSNIVISDRALNNLKLWYQADIDIYNWCIKNKESINRSKKHELS